MCQPPDELLKISDSSASYGVYSTQGTGFSKKLCRQWMEKWNQSLEKGTELWPPIIIFVSTCSVAAMALEKLTVLARSVDSFLAKYFMWHPRAKAPSMGDSHMDQIPNEGSWVTSSTANPKLSAIGSHVCRPHAGSSLLIAIPTRNPLATPASCRQDTYMATLKIKVSLLAFVSDIKLKSNSTSCHWPQV